MITQVFFAVYKNFRGFGVHALILMSNGDFTPIFFNFVNLPLRFQNEAKIYPYSVYLS